VTSHYETLGRRIDVGYVFLLENRSEALGMTLHHAHGQRSTGCRRSRRYRPPELAEARRYPTSTGSCIAREVVAHEETAPWCPSPPASPWSDREPALPPTPFAHLNTDAVHPALAITSATLIVIREPIHCARFRSRYRRCEYLS
jgi:hypothetical protein